MFINRFAINVPTYGEAIAFTIVKICDRRLSLRPSTFRLLGRNFLAKPKVGLCVVVTSFSIVSIVTTWFCGLVVPGVVLEEVVCLPIAGPPLLGRLVVLPKVVWLRLHIFLAVLVRVVKGRIGLILPVVWVVLTVVRLILAIAGLILAVAGLILAIVR